MDGFPEMLVIAATADRHTPKLLISKPCAKGLAGCDANGQGRRGFRLLGRGAESLEAVYDARGVTFIDMDEDVRIFFVLCLQGDVTRRCRIGDARCGRTENGSAESWHNNVHPEQYLL